MSKKYPNLLLTNFPEAIDSIPNFLDVTSADATLIAQYQTAIQNGNFTQASSILAQITNAEQKTITAKRLNSLVEPVLAMEQFYSTDIKPYIEDKQTEWENRVNQFSYIGTYNSTTNYVKNNIVLFNDNGLKKLYLCIADIPTTNINPYNTTYWREFTIRGAQGLSGDGSTFQFAWDSSVDYQAQAIVVNDNAWWYATQANRNQEPFDGSEYWDLILNVTQVIYPIQTQQPTTQSTGELWFKVVG